ncbi:MAG: hypothetical protein Q8P46_05735 [Hyphomicrobiales bacterium]|nr:hypothetical protein [Hyphomicrobiales bacterium]
MILRRGQARLAGRCGASAISRNTATAQKNPAFGGPNRPIESNPYNHEPL